MVLVLTRSISRFSFIKKNPFYNLKQDSFNLERAEKSDTYK